MCRNWRFFRTCLFTLAYLLVFYLWAWGQPTVVAVDLSKAKLTWTWAQAGGGPVEKWQVRCGPALDNWPLMVELLDPAARSLPLATIIKSNGSYVCMVRALNSFGTSPDSPTVTFSAGQAPVAATAVKIESP